MRCDTRDTSRTASIISYIDAPVFDSLTGQLSTIRHHVLDGPASISCSFAPEYTIILPQPPEKPFQESTKDEETYKPRKRRRKSVQERSPLDWINARQQDDKLHEPDQQERKQHTRLVPMLEAGIAGLQEAQADTPWVAKGSLAVQWMHERPSDRKEMPFSEIVSRDGTLPSFRNDNIDVADSDGRFQVSLLVNRIVQNTTKEFKQIEVEHEKEVCNVVMPPSSAFALSDFASWSEPALGIGKLGQQHGGWDVIVIDPPWPNASASRSSTYGTFDPYSLGKLDLKGIMGSHPTLVACWVTNRVKYRKLLRDKLMPSWGVEKTCDWYWIKTTANGEPIWPLDGNHRRCYEGLMVGWYNPEGVKNLSDLPPAKLFMSTLLGHSRKPCILDLLEPFLPPERQRLNILELFARTVLSGTDRGLYCSLGNECIKFNVVDDETAGHVMGWVKPAKSSIDP
ncbi:hypothetical protein OIV83_000064 [Microbotryomycetes sp. JL201]|nr:hypothetical protein OIV83_000064 [Microbotryomycetes sp. JL201]